MSRIVITLPWPSPLLSPNARVHWSKKSRAAKAHRKASHVLTKMSGAVIDWEGEAHLWITFYPPDRRARDDDNLIASFKSSRDGIADALGIDDKRFRTHPWVSDVVRKGGCVEVVITKGPELTTVARIEAEHKQLLKELK